MTEINSKSTDTIDGINVIKHNFNDDSSHFTKSNRTAPNLATYYFKHEETDSDMDKLEQNATKTDTHSTFGETSEEEWTYTKTSVMELTDDNRNGDNQNEFIETVTDIKEEAYIIPKPKAIPEDTIRKLVLKAEQLVNPEKCRKTERSKLSKVNKWLSIDKPDDSCDASGEDDEKESQTSEDFDASTTTLRYNSQNASFSELSTPERQWRSSCVLPMNETSPW